MDNKYKVITDPEYGYLRVDPVPTQEEVEKYYIEEFYSSAYKQFNNSSLKVQKEDKVFFDSRWESIFNRCLEYFGDGKQLSMFDIGCGFAQALLYFREKGMEVSGLEPAMEAIEYAKTQGLKVFQAQIEDFNCVGSKRFDVVLLLNVLEHLRYPAETLLSMKEKILKPKGLLIINVPNEFNDFQLIASEEFRLDNWWVCPPNHINYFSAKSLKHLLAKCDYNIFDYQSSFPLEMFMLMGDVYVGDSKLGKMCHQRRVKFEYLMKKHGKAEKLRRFYKYLADLDLGREITIYATPCS